MTRIKSLIEYQSLYFWFGAEIQDESNLNSSGLQIVQGLSDMGIVNSPDGLQLKEDRVLDYEVSTKITYQFPAKGHLNQGLLVAG